MRRPVRFPALVAAGVLGAAALPALAEQGDFAHSHLIPLEDEVFVPEPSLHERAAERARDAWRTLSGTASDAADAAASTLSPVVRDLKDAVAPAVDAARDALGPTASAVSEAAAPALASVGATADRAWSGAEGLAADARVQAERLATSVSATAAEVRAHPAMQAVADAGLLFRIVEGVGVTALVGGMAWRKLRGA
ncbi:hypothetical protein [Azospirillum sp. A39]|uniref:hypothetical protein n=1 Tax=Azospirillum sp. A39 TaxID=3462279 RepID=UPI0040465032